MLLCQMQPEAYQTLCQNALGDHQAMSVIGRMNVHKREGRLILINLLTVAGPSDDLAEYAVEGTHIVSPLGR